MREHHQTVAQMTKMLKNLERWLDKGVAFAEQKKFDPANLLAARLAPDQFPLLRQIQAATDNAKFAAARVAGKEAPRHPDTEQSVDEVRTRLRSVIDYVASYTEADFEGSEDRKVSLFFLPGKAMSTSDYLREFAVPNFYFHCVTAYSILRHNGVELGKTDFIGSLTLEDA